MADHDLDKSGSHSAQGGIKSDTPAPGRTIEEQKRKIPASETQEFTDPSTSGGATSDDQDSATGQHHD